MTQSYVLVPVGNTDKLLSYLSSVWVRAVLSRSLINMDGYFLFVKVSGIIFVPLKGVCVCEFTNRETL